MGRQRYQLSATPAGRRSRERTADDVLVVVDETLGLVDIIQPGHLDEPCRGRRAGEQSQLARGQ
jgi:hypothetical protein